jgi:predicted porin
MLRDKVQNDIGLAAVLAVAVLAGSAGSAHAGGGDDCCADLEARIVELEAMVAFRGNDKVSVEVSGYLNNGIMYWDDGFSDNVNFVTNETERSRLAFTAKAKIAPKLSAGGLLEIGVHGNRENQFDQDDPLSPGKSRLPDVRYSYWWLEQEDLGKLTVGRLRMATYHIVDMMLTETWYFARYGIGTWIGSEGTGFFLRLTDGTLTDGTNPLRWGDIDAHAPAATPGEGLRTEGVKYETPEIAGFTGSMGYTGLGGADVALRYTGDIGDMKLTAGIGYGEYWNHDARRCAVVVPGDVDCRTLGLSGTLMHVPTGFYFYGAYGVQQDLDVRALFQAPVDNIDQSYYVQAGVERKFVAAGKTTIFAEFEHDDIGAGVKPSTGGILNTTALGPPGDPSYNRMAGSEIDTWGLGIAQGIDAAAMELYVSGRLFDADVLTSATGLKAGAVETPIEDFLIIMGGAKIAF